MKVTMTAMMIRRRNGRRSRFPAHFGRRVFWRWGREACFNSSLNYEEDIIRLFEAISNSTTPLPLQIRLRRRQRHLRPRGRFPRPQKETPSQATPCVSDFFAPQTHRCTPSHQQSGSQQPQQRLPPRRHADERLDHRLRTTTGSCSKKRRAATNKKRFRGC